VTRKPSIAFVVLVVSSIGCAGGQASRGKGGAEDDAGETETGGAMATGGRTGTGGGGGGQPGTGGVVSGVEAGVVADAELPPAADGAAGMGGGPGPTSDDPPCQRMVPVSGPAALPPALAAARPGDCLVAADGAYGALDLGAKGTAEAPIQLRAANQLKASATNLKLDQSEYLIVRGFSLSTVLFVNTKWSRVTRCQIKGPGSGYWVRIEEQKGCMSGCTDGPPGTSDHARVDHCDIGGASSSSDIFNPTAFATNSRIDHNYVHDTSGPHLMTLGCCGPKFDYFESGTIIEQNLFVNASGTSAEMISIKGAGVHFRYNTIRKHSGDVDIRAGKNNAIYGNFILGPGPGIRMYEDNHRVYNNYVNGGLSGNQSGPIHAPVKNATIVHNLFTGGVALASGSNNVSANNILLGGGGGTGNLGGTAASLGFVQMGDLLTIAAGSKAIGAATGSYPFLTDDIFGHPRGAKPDVGPEQLSTDPPLRTVLTPADVGPMAP
jgi:hypothetical protein